MYKNVEHAYEEKSYIDSVIIMYKNVEFVYEEKSVVFGLFYVPYSH